MSSQPRFRKRNADHPDRPAARGPGGYTLAHAGRQFRLGPIAFWTAVSVLVTMALWTAGTATYFAFRDDLLTGLIARQAEMQYAYEDRIAEMRAQVDRLTSRQLLDQEQVEGRIERLLARQAVLESRSSALSGSADPAGTPTTKSRALPRIGASPLSGAKPSPLEENAVRPGDRSELEPDLLAPEGQRGHGRTLRTMEAALARVEQSLDRVEARQGAAVFAMEDGVDGKARRIHSVLTELGLDLGKLPRTGAQSGVGGPFIPVSPRSDLNGFEKNLQRIQLARANLDVLTRTLTAVPVRRPLAGELDTSSGFGVRYDPFIRSPAMHAGHDFRAPAGEPVRATAAGRVFSAGWSGGYGRMIEIDHGNGFSTRYGHLSEILVEEDQAIRPGQIIGRVGSTGRSTGPHLHYETRIEGEAVDPLRFLRAGIRLGGDL